MEFSNSTILNIYIITPFVFALILSALMFVKNPIYIRNLSKTFFFFEFAFTVSTVTFLSSAKTTLFDFDFCLDKTSSVLLFLTGFLFFIFSIISKTFIIKSYRAFYSILLTMYGLINLTLLSDNILVGFVSIFWIFLVQYLLARIFSKKTKDALSRIILNFVWLFGSLFLIFKDFFRYFILNGIDFNYSLLSKNLYHINDNSTILAFFGFLILIFHFFDFIPFLNMDFKDQKFIKILNRTSLLILGSFILVKIYTPFDYILYDYQTFIANFLLFNLAWNTLIVFKQDKFINFLDAQLKINLLIVLFLLFTFENTGIITLILAISAIIVSYVLCYLILLILGKTFKTDSFEEFKKINDRSGLEKFFVFISLLNISNIPFLAIFISILSSLLIIFSFDYDSPILNIAPYFLLLCAFISSYCSTKAIYKTLIEPIDVYKKTIFSKHQILVFWLLFIAIAVLGIFFGSIANQLISTLDIGKF